MENWSIKEHSEKLLTDLLTKSRLPLHPTVLDPANRATIVNDGDDPPIPCPFFATEGIVALKALEGTCASALAQVRFAEPADASIDVFTALPSLFIHNVSEVEGLGLFTFGQPNAGSTATRQLTKADLHQVFVNPYRHAVSGMYRSKDGRVVHLHGSLNSTPTLASLGLPPFIDGLQEAEAIELIQSKASTFTADELQQQAECNKMPGQIMLTPEVGFPIHTSSHRPNVLPRSSRLPLMDNTYRSNRFGSKKSLNPSRRRCSSSKGPKICWQASKFWI
jgi:hypothetical protein